MVPDDTPRSDWARKRRRGEPIVEARVRVCTGCLAGREVLCRLPLGGECSQCGGVARELVMVRP